MDLDGTLTGLEVHCTGRNVTFTGSQVDCMDLDGACMRLKDDCIDLGSRVAISLYLRVNFRALAVTNFTFGGHLGL